MHLTCLYVSTGAFLPGAPVLPVLLTYSKTHHNPAWTIIDVPFHVLRLLCQFVNTVDVNILPVYVPSDTEQADPALYAANVRRMCAEMLRLPLVDQVRAHMHDGHHTWLLVNQQLL